MIRKAIILILFCAMTSIGASGAVKLPAVISDGMIIQREKPVCVWGWADPLEEFKLTWKEKEWNVKAEEDGKWKVILPGEKAGGPYTMIIGDKVVRDILIGDVFLCSGQSNMELPIRRVTDMFAEEVAGYENTAIRQFIVPKVYDFNTPREDFDYGSWTPCTQEHVMNFSALAYFYAKEIFRNTGVPVGIVNASWGGTPVEAWTSEEWLADYPHYINEKRIYEDEGYCKRIKTLEGENFHRWNTTLNSSDPGLAVDMKWYSADYDDSSWTEVEMLSKDWGNDGLNPQGGSHWLRKDFKVGKEMAGKEAVLRLGCIVDADSAYVNGHFVGNITYQYPPRIYKIPAGILKEGNNNVTVRIVSNGGQPSFVPEKPYKVICGKEEISLEGKWKYRQGAQMPPAPSMMFFCYKPVCLYNAMIHPLKGLAFSGVLWYQGESNVDNRNEYADLLSLMIGNWRETLGDAGLPFYIVELADFLHHSDVNGRAAWAEMRQEQAKVAKTNSNTCLIRNSDLGEWNDIHPLDKKTLGIRAANATLENLTY